MSELVNCGQCAHLWNRAQPGFGVCACHARQEQTGQIRPTVALDATCEHAQISAKCDPDFFPRLRAARRGDWPAPEPQSDPLDHESDPAEESPQNTSQEAFQDAAW